MKKNSTFKAICVNQQAADEIYYNHYKLFRIYTARYIKGRKNVLYVFRHGYEDHDNEYGYMFFKESWFHKAFIILPKDFDHETDVHKAVCFEI